MHKKQSMIPGTETRTSCPDRDIRYTPALTVIELLEWWPPPLGATVIEPAAGEGAIVWPLLDRGYTVLANEIRPEAADVISAREPVGGFGYRGANLTVVTADWIQLVNDWHYRQEGLLRNVIIRGAPWRMPSIATNPPYSIGPTFMAVCLAIKPGYCAALLRANHLGSATWGPFWRKHPPQGLRFLSGAPGAAKRPSFTADGKSDASEYVWVVWSTYTRGEHKQGSIANITFA
jgi:hypothetical protein